MPSKSQAEHNFMEMIAHDPSKAKQFGIPQKVGKDFEKADKGKKFDPVDQAEKARALRAHRPYTDTDE